MLVSRDASADEEREAGLKFRVHVPGGEPVAGRPLVVLVHGRAGDRTLMWIFSKALQGEALKRLQPVVVTPEAFLVDEKGGYSWWPVRDKLATVDEALRAEGLREVIYATEVFRRFVANIERMFRTDPSFKIAGGFSQGAALSATTSLLAPELFRGVALLAGFVPQSVLHQQGVLAEGIRPKARYFIAHGTEDRIIPFSRAEQARDWLLEHGAEVSFHSDAVAHKVGAASIRALGEWFERLWTS